MRISKTIKEAIENGMKDSEDMGDGAYISRIKGHVLDVLAHKFHKYTSQEDQAKAEQFMELWQSIKEDVRLK